LLVVARDDRSNLLAHDSQLGVIDGAADQHHAAASPSREGALFELSSLARMCNRLTMRKILAAALLVLTGCATNPPPIIDVAGKDPVQTNRDLAECQNHPYDHIQFIGPNVWTDRGFPISRCLESMGYKVLSRTQ
jgi:hypothetical protein